MLKNYVLANNNESILVASTRSMRAFHDEGSTAYERACHSPRTSCHGSSTSCPEKTHRRRFSLTKNLKAAGKAGKALNRLHKPAEMSYQQDPQLSLGTTILAVKAASQFKNKLKRSSSLNQCPSSFCSKDPELEPEVSFTWELKLVQENESLKDKLQTAATLGQALLEEKTELEDLVNEMDEEISILDDKVEEVSKEMLKYKKLYEDKCEDMKIIEEEAELRSQKNREIQDLSKKLEFEKQKSKQLQDEIDDIQAEIRHAQARERQIQMQTESTGTDSTRLEGLSELGQSHFNGVFDEKRMKQEELLAKTEELREALSQSQDQLEVLAVKSANAETEIEELKLQLESVLEENQQAQMAILGQNEVIASLRAELSLTKQQLDAKGRPRWSSWRSDNSDVGEDSSLASISGLLNQDANKEEVDVLKEKIERLQSMNAQAMTAVQTLSLVCQKVGIKGDADCAAVVDRIQNLLEQIVSNKGTPQEEQSNLESIEVIDALPKIRMCLRKKAECLPDPARDFDEWQKHMQKIKNHRIVGVTQLCTPQESKDLDEKAKIKMTLMKAKANTCKPRATLPCVNSVQLENAKKDLEEWQKYLIQAQPMLP